MDQSRSRRETVAWTMANVRGIPKAPSSMSKATACSAQWLVVYMKDTVRMPLCYHLVTGRGHFLIGTLTIASLQGLGDATRNAT